MRSGMDKVPFVRGDEDGAFMLKSHGVVVRVEDVLLFVWRELHCPDPDDRVIAHGPFHRMQLQYGSICGSARSHFRTTLASTTPIVSGHCPVANISI